MLTPVRGAGLIVWNGRSGGGNAYCITLALETVYLKPLTIYMFCTIVVCEYVAFGCSK